MRQKTVHLTLGLIASFLVVLLILSLLLIQLTTAATTVQTLHGRVIILDPGHGQGNTNIFEGYDEQVRMLALAHRIKPLLEERGATVLMTRPTEEDVILPVRAAMLNRWALEAIRDARQRELEFSESEQGARRVQRDLDEIDRLLAIIQSVIDDPERNAPIYLNFPFDTTYTRAIHPDWRRIFELQNDPLISDNYLVISLHSNATPRPINTAMNGVDIFYMSNARRNNGAYFANYAHERHSFHFANLLIDNIVTTGLNKRGVSPHYFLIIREHNLPAVLVENGFHTNAADRARLQDDAFLDRLAMVYADTISHYFANMDEIPDQVPGRLHDILLDIFGTR